MNLCQVLRLCSPAEKLLGRPLRKAASLMWRCLFGILPTETVVAGYHVNFSGSGWIFGRRTCPKRLGTAVRCIWGDSQDRAIILNPLGAIFGVLRPDPLSETSTSVLSQQQTSVLSPQQTSVLSQQKTSVLSQLQTSATSEAAWRSWRGLTQKLTKTI